MNLNSILGNFVKFVRGTPTAYNNLQQKNPDTLYFIAENNASSGKLYLGNKLIGGSITGATSLSELVDVFLDNNLSVNHILVYEGNHWVNKDIRDIFEISIGTMQGATKDTDGKVGQYLRRRPINRTLIFEEMEHGIILQLHTLNKLIL